ncbi:MAG: hypothetical protein KGO82_06605 [Bacteroidota bacterium]|nr:hypothetical protein [Bacteroidota bacterium]
MKKIIITLAFAFLSAGVFARDNNNGISQKAISTVNNYFAGATDLNWEKADNFYKASFRLRGLYLNALISSDGEIIAVSRNIVSSDLPLTLQAALGKRLDGSWITELTEYVIDGNTVYYVTLDNADERVVFQSAGTYDWTFIKKIAR